jgi:hypothetical protein
MIIMSMGENQSINLFSIKWPFSVLFLGFFPPALESTTINLDNLIIKFNKVFRTGDLFRGTPGI